MSRTDETLRFDVEGVPAPQGSKKGFVVKGRAVLVESSKKVKPWRHRVKIKAKAVALAHGFEKITTGPVAVDLCFWMPSPARWVRPFPSTIPDIDKLTRSTLDALTGTLYKDDGQVCDLDVKKRYDPDGFQGVTIRVSKLDDDADGALRGPKRKAK